MWKSFMFSPQAEICSHQFCLEYIWIRNKLIKNVYVPKFHEETLPIFLENRAANIISGFGDQDE